MCWRWTLRRREGCEDDMERREGCEDDVDGGEETGRSEPHSWDRSEIRKADLFRYS